MDVPTQHTNTGTTLLRTLGLELDLYLAHSREGEEFPYLHRTNYRRGPGGSFLPLRSWTHLQQLLAEVTANGDPDHLPLQHALLPNSWAQLAPEYHDRHRVELSDGTGWVDHFCSLHPDHTWDTTKAEMNLRKWVSQEQERGDGYRVRIPRRP